MAVGASGKACNLPVLRFIPPVVNLRVSMLVAGLCAGVLHGQAAGTSQAVTPPSGTPGAAPTRADGVPPTAPGLRNGTTSGTNTSTTGGRGRRRGRNPANANSGTNTSSGGGNHPASSTTQPPAPAATDKVEVTGRPAENTTGTFDRPLLPIVTAGNALGIRSGTPIRVQLRAAVDSGHARNGDMVDATLVSPIGRLPAGTPVRLTVVQAAPAGRITSFGQLSLQVVSIGDQRVLSDTITAQGKEGTKELPDAAPARGTEAIFTPDQPISLPAS